MRLSGFISLTAKSTDRSGVNLAAGCGPRATRRASRADAGPDIYAQTPASLFSDCLAVSHGRHPARRPGAAARRCARHAATAAAAGRPGRTRRRARRADCPGRRFQPQAAGGAADAGGTAEAVPAAARLPHRAGPLRSAHRGSRRRDLRRQRPDVRPRDALLHAGRRRLEFARADQPHLAARGHRRRRHLRQAHRLRRQDGDAAHGVSARGRRDPRARDRQPRHVQVHRHQR